MTKVIASLAFVALIAAPASARNNGEAMSAYPQFGAEPDGYWQRLVYTSTDHTNAEPVTEIRRGAVTDVVPRTGNERTKSTAVAGRWDAPFIRNACKSLGPSVNGITDARHRVRY